MSTSVSDPSLHRSYARKPWQFALIFILLLFVGDRVCGVLLAELVRASDHRLSRIYAGAAKADILVLGNSVGNAMLIPTKIEPYVHRSVFSMALHGMDAVTQKAFVLDYLDHQPAPKLALIEARPVFSRTLTAPAFSTYQALSDRVGGALREAEGTSVRWSSVFHTYRVNSPQLPAILFKIVKRDDQKTGPSNGQINRAMIADWGTRTQMPSVSADQLLALEESVRRLQIAGTKVIVIMAPIHPAARRDGQWVQSAMLRLRLALPRETGLINLSNALSSDQFFEDPIHLNQKGREVLQPKLVAIIQEKLK